jgi:hypothetical protein
VQNHCIIREKSVTLIGGFAPLTPTRGSAPGPRWGPTAAPRPLPIFSSSTSCPHQKFLDPRLTIGAHYFGAFLRIAIIQVAPSGAETKIINGSQLSYDISQQPQFWTFTSADYAESMLVASTARKTKQARGGKLKTKLFAIYCAGALNSFS